MNDLISRQAAIDAVYTHGTELEQRGITVLAVANHKQVTVDLLEQLPSAQPEIIKCKDCKYYKQSEWLFSHMCCHYVIGSTVVRKPNDFCSRAERI